MRLFVHNTTQYISSLATSIAKDPLSLSAWRCMHIAPQQAGSFDTQALHNLSLTFSALDCDVVVCPDGDILCISRQLNNASLYNLAAAITVNDIDIVPEIKMYDLFADWKEIRQLLLAKSPTDTDATLAPARAIIEENNPLRVVFASTTQHRKTRKSHYVMIVEDDPMTRRMVSNAFRQEYAVVTASNAHDAIANYLIYAPDIVFLDIGLPDSSGFEVLKDIVATDNQAYVVMFSGNSYLDNVTAALNSGASGFVAKPFKKENLMHYVEDSVMHHQRVISNCNHQSDDSVPRNGARGAVAPSHFVHIDHKMV